MEITADVKKIDDISSYFFEVPDYQREYVWQPDDQVEQFIIDIDNEYTEIHANQKSYFLGSMIIVENSKTGRYDVIDGQQRLTTIILALCAFRNILDEYRQSNPLNEVATEYFKRVKELLYEFNMENNSRQTRLELQYDDSKTFLNDLIESRLYAGDKTSSINKMNGAYSKLKNHFSGYLNESIDKLTEYLRYFLLKIELVIIESEDLGSALKIFETINQRGSGLNAMDLVKNLIFSYTDEANFELVKNIWKDLNEYLEECNEQKPLRFLRYFLMARYHDGIIREDEIYKWIISEGRNQIGYEQNPVQFAKELKNSAKRYSDLVIATESYTNGSQMFPHVCNIGFINKFKSRQHLVLLLAPNDQTSNADIDYLAKQIESFYLFAVMQRLQAKYLEGTFANWASKLRNTSSRSEIENVVNATIKERLSRDYGVIRSNFNSRLDTEIAPLYHVRFILGKIENYLREKANLPTESISFFDQMQVEHILPQSPLDGELTEEFNDWDDYWYTVHSIGNITLVESQINQAINSYNDLNGSWYEDKYSEYINSNIFMTKMLNPNFGIGNQTGVNRLIQSSGYQFVDWNKMSIKKRSTILFDLAKKIWTINDHVLEPHEEPVNEEE
ncbi:MAG: DUF262 domain-containing protein [Crocinitomicaceae bacterium]|nr:DUF262 domain-containing protein [Crocinitomicaceae bacterium]